MSDLITQLRAALDMDEYDAKRAAAAGPPNWSEGADWLDTLHRYVARHSPEFVLADIAAKRKILDDAEAAHAEWEEDTADHERGTYSSALEYVVELLAEAYGITEDGAALGHDWRDVPGRSRYYRHCNRCGVRDVETTSTICPSAPYGYPQQSQPGARG